MRVSGWIDGGSKRRPSFRLSDRSIGSGSSSRGFCGSGRLFSFFGFDGFRKCLRNDKREQEGCIAIDLDRIGLCARMTPQRHSNVALIGRRRRNNRTIHAEVGSFFSCWLQRKERSTRAKKERKEHGWRRLPRVVLRTESDFAPGYCLIRASTAVTTVELLTRVDEDRVVSSIPDSQPVSQSVSQAASRGHLVVKSSQYCVLMTMKSIPYSMPCPSCINCLSHVSRTHLIKLALHVWCLHKPPPRMIIPLFFAERAMSLMARISRAISTINDGLFL